MSENPLWKQICWISLNECRHEAFRCKDLDLSPHYLPRLSDDSENILHSDVSAVYRWKSDAYQQGTWRILNDYYCKCPLIADFFPREADVVNDLILWELMD